MQWHLHQHTKLKQTAMPECQRVLNGSLITLIADISTECGWFLLRISSPATYNEVANGTPEHAKMPMQ